MTNSNPNAVIVVVSAIVSAAVAFGVGALPGVEARSLDSDRSVSTASIKRAVLARGSIRCGYLSYAPGTIVDPNGGGLSGICVDVIERAADDLGLKLEWVEEVTWGGMIQGLENRRYDLVVAPIWPNAARAKHVVFSEPLYYSGVGVYARSGDERFSSGLDAIDSPDVKISALDGEMALHIANTEFPSAQVASLPENSDFSQMMLAVATGKADVTFAETYQAEEFLSKQPGTLANVVPEEPLYVFGNTLIADDEAEDLISMIDVAIGVLRNSGYVDHVVAKYENSPGVLYRNAPPFRKAN